MTPTACKMCGEEKHITIFNYDDPDVYERAAGVAVTDYARAWVACNSCRFCYSRYSRDPSVLDRLYDEAYRGSEASWRSASAEEVFRQVIALPAAESETVARCTAIKADLMRFAREGIHTLSEHRPNRLLDVGGATGVFAYLFQDEDWKAEIVDPGKQGRFIEAFGVTYHQRRFDSGFHNGRYHLVSMVYMLEHVDDPWETVRQVKNVLTDDGLLYIEVPDAIAFEKKPREDDIFNSCHLWMFDPASLTGMLSSCGFDPLDIRRVRTHRGHYALTMLARPL